MSKFMKIAFFTIALVLIWSVQVNAQISINKSTIDVSSVLDFGAGTTKGIILPIVESLPTTAVNGTILMDKNEQKVKMKQNGVWVNMSGIGNVSRVNFNTSSDVSTNGIIIGSPNSTALGVLVLESNTKALILPKINSPHLNVKSPVAGMICYDTASNCVAIFDGTNWNYWK
jgi:hypothetical protein